MKVHTHTQTHTQKHTAPSTKSHTHTITQPHRSTQTSKKNEIQRRAIEEKVKDFPFSYFINRIPAEVVDHKILILCHHNFSKMSQLFGITFINPKANTQTQTHTHLHTNIHTQADTDRHTHSHTPIQSMG